MIFPLVLDPLSGGGLAATCLWVLNRSILGTGQHLHKQAKAWGRTKSKFGRWTRSETSSQFAIVRMSNILAIIAHSNGLFAV
jgi:hypothetical protein